MLSNHIKLIYAKFVCYYFTLCITLYTDPTIIYTHLKPHCSTNIFDRNMISSEYSLTFLSIGRVLKCMTEEHEDSSLCLLVHTW